MKQWNSITIPIVLASQSPRRRDILASMGLSFSVASSAVEDEEHFFREATTPTAALRALARAKALDVATDALGSLVIGADTIVYHKGRALGKPASREEAFAVLSELSGETHQVMTGVALLSSGIGYAETSITTTEVAFRRLTPAEINRYLDLNSYADKAGSYGIQDEAFLFVDHIHGCYHNIVGLPVAATIAMLQQFQEVV